MAKNNIDKNISKPSPLFDTDKVIKEWEKQLKREEQLEEQRKWTQEAMDKLEESKNKKDIMYIDEPELHLHLNNEIKIYLQQIIQKQVEEKVYEIYKETIEPIQNKMEQSLNEVSIVLKGAVNVADNINESKKIQEEDERRKIFNSGLFAGAGGLNLKKEKQIPIRIMQGDDIIYDNYSDMSVDEVISGLQVECNLAEILREKGISQAWLANQLGVNRNTITNIIAKPSSISYLNVMKISLLLEEPISKLFPILEPNE